MEHANGATRSAWRPSASLLVFCTCLVVYLALYLFVPAGKGMETRTIGDEPHYLVMAESILRDGDLSLANNYASRGYQKEGYHAGVVLEPHVTAGRHGRVVPWHQVLTSLVILPGYAAAGARGAGATMALVMSVAALFTFLVLGKFAARRTAAFVTLFFFLTYPLLAYSHLIYPEVFALLLLVVGTWAALEAKEGKGPGFFLLAGLAAALLPHFHSKFGVLAAALAALVLLCAPARRRWLGYFFVPLGISLVALALWTYYLYGPDIIRGLTVTGGRAGFFGGDSPWGIPGLYLDRAWGLLPFAPLYIALFVGMPLPRSRRSFSWWWIYIPLTTAVYTVVVGGFREWHGGAAPVPRYLVPLLPLFVLCSCLVVSSIKRNYARVALGALALIQVFLTVYARIFPAATLGLPRARNELYHYIFPDSFAGSVLDRLFPLFHPVTARSLAVLAAWVILITAIVWWRRHYLRESPQMMLQHGDERPVPVTSRAGGPG